MKVLLGKSMRIEPFLSGTICIRKLFIATLSGVD
jgi:hypothetical protein